MTIPSEKNLFGETAYTTRLDGALAIMREINRITFEKRALEWFERHAPQVVDELRKRGVRFPGNGGDGSSAGPADPERRS